MCPGIGVPGDSEFDVRILRKFAFEVHPVADVFAHHQLGHLGLDSLGEGERIGKLCGKICLGHLLQETPFRCVGFLVALSLYPR